MQRRNFIKDTGLVAVGMGVFGSIHWSADRFVGNNATTTDTLGPFYRPGAPFRRNVNPTSYKGKLLHLSGCVYRDDAKTPFKNAVVEIWQCKPDDAKYDNTSDDFLYRGSQKVGTDGKYYFMTADPVPYPTEANPSIYRPAHIHLRISGKGQQDLITQIYFTGDPYLQTDPGASSPLSIQRILDMRKLKENESAVTFDVVLRKEFLPDPELIRHITGVYRMSDKSLMEFYMDGDLLFWKWNGQIHGALSYNGYDAFVGGTNDIEAKFGLQPKGVATVVLKHTRRTIINVEGRKILAYRS